jgi:deoxyribonuclease IV
LQFGGIMQIGAHINTLGGIQSATERAAQLEINCMQIFTKNQRQWFSAKLKEDEIDEYLENVQVYDIKTVFSHASTLLNLSTPDKILLDKSQRSFLDEINRAEILNLAGVVFHLGTYAGQRIDESIKIASESINMLIDNTRKYNSKLIIENIAGQGRSLGSTFEQIEKVIEGVELKSRIGVCLDTAHLFAAGYNIKPSRGYRKTMEEFDDIIGLNLLSLINLNDSGKGLGSRQDKHMNLGEGLLGKDFFHNILHDKKLKNIPFILEKLKNIPFILETPGDMEGYHKDIEFVRKMLEVKRFFF